MAIQTATPYLILHGRAQQAIAVAAAQHGQVIRALALAQGPAQR